MAERIQSSTISKEGTAERGWRFLRNINALGAVAVAGIATLIPGPNLLLASYAGLKAGQAGFFEIARQSSKSKRLKREAKHS